jgi:uncharacterized protein (TIGR03792 family)
LQPVVAVHTPFLLLISNQPTLVLECTQSSYAGSVVILAYSSILANWQAQRLKGVVIEFLKFQVAPDLRENFIQKDGEIWTAALAKYPGFISKEVWINPNHHTEVILIIRWSTREQWKAYPKKIYRLSKTNLSKQWENPIRLWSQPSIKYGNSPIVDGKA